MRRATLKRVGIASDAYLHPDHIHNKPFIFLYTCATDDEACWIDLAFGTSGIASHDRAIVGVFVSFLWVAFLIVGIDYLPRLVQSIRSVTTDLLQHQQVEAVLTFQPPASSHTTFTETHAGR